MTGGEKQERKNGMKETKEDGEVGRIEKWVIKKRSERRKTGKREGESVSPEWR